ncbi:MAG: aminotransferase class V-fold PLP-dependent enzyme [Bacteroidetes bacterium]|nr:aminotransferase class V-fold PLP-dependent enzyme [Bacteroidota bacterium]
MISSIGLSLVNSDHLMANQVNTDSASLCPEGTGVQVNDEQYWTKIRALFNIPTQFINLENGYFSPQPKSTIAVHQKREDYINTQTSMFMRKEQATSIEASRTSLAHFLDCPSVELAFTRNTTESMNILIAGYDWKVGDEVIIGNQDYGSMVDAFHQAAKRYGIVIKVAEIPLHPESEDDLVRAYTRLFSSQTRLVHLTHLINLTGQVIPVAQIADKAHLAGVEVAVDAAHSVAHLQFTIPELKADYVSASLHKWLCNPLGAGFLWMKQEHISRIFPLTADGEYPVNDIRKFEHQGTRPIHTLETIHESIRFHQKIGSKLKQDRLRFLMRYWVTKVVDLPRIKINSPYLHDYSCSAIANVAIEGYTPAKLSDRLFAEYGIFTVAIDHPAVQGVRVTPHLYTSLEELDKLVLALKQMAQ